MRFDYNYKRNDTGVKHCPVWCLLLIVILSACSSDQDGLRSQVLIKDEENNLTIWDTLHATHTPLDLKVYDAIWSPNGKRIAFWDLNSNIGVFEPESNQVLQLSSIYAPYRGPNLSWSPDGRRLTYIGYSKPERSYRIYVIDLQNVSDPPQSWPCAHVCSNPNWMPNSTEVAFSEELPIVDMHLQSRMSKLNILTGQVEPLFLVNHDVAAVRWNPDRSRMAFASNSEGVFLRSEAGDEEHIVDYSFANLCWSRDGSYLFFSQFGSVVKIYSLATGKIYQSKIPGYVLDCRD
jgi:WD40 repeat protein